MILTMNDIGKIFLHDICLIIIIFYFENILGMPTNINTLK